MQGACDLYALVVDDLHVDGPSASDGGRVRVCGTGGQTQITHVYTSTSSTLKLVLHRVLPVDDDDVAGYNFLLRYEGQCRPSDIDNGSITQSHVNYVGHATIMS